MKKFLLLMMAATAINAPAFEFVYEYDTENGTCAITGWTGDDDSEVIELPEKIYEEMLERTFTVTAVHPWALNNIKNVKRVKIPSTIQEIGGCLNNGYTDLGIANFLGCPALEAFEVADGNRWFRTTPEGALMSSKSTILYRLPQAAAIDGGAFILPATTHVIVTDALSGNSTASVITLPANLAVICDEAGFHSMSQLRQIVSRSEIFTVTDDCLINRQDYSLVAFPPASGATSLYVPGGCRVIRPYAIAKSPTLTSLEFKASDVTLKHSAISDCPKLTTITFPEVVNIEKNGIYSANDFAKLVITNVTGEEEPFMLRGNGDYTPDVYVRTSATKPEGALPLSKLFGEYYGATATPHFFCEALTPAEGYEMASAEYNVPALTMGNYDKASTVQEMFSLNLSNDNGYARVESHAYGAGINMLSCTFNGTSTKNFNSAGVVTESFPYSDTENLTLTYMVNGVEMTTTYPAEMLKSSGISDACADDSADAPRLVIYHEANATPGATYLDMTGRSCRPAEGAPCIEIPRR